MRQALKSSHGHIVVHCFAVVVVVVTAGFYGMEMGGVNIGYLSKEYIVIVCQCLRRNIFIAMETANDKYSQMWLYTDTK